MVKRDLCHFLNDKRLICVKNIYPKGAIFSLLISIVRWRRGGIMKVCGTGHVRVYCFPVWLFHRLFNLTSQVQHDNELYFCDRRGRILSG